ncbi:hypothetical protein MNBD_GAMMA08-1593 [hydrothermal vent metagenome]|uniref:Uncharacterized protein n=1 Tax=hydrothermal vent metagenome TaxID=652676 RepID=A0A3B0XXN2_9ZZZZ
MQNAMQYFDQKTPGLIIAGKKDGANDLGVFYTGTREDLETLRDLINESIDQLQNPVKTQRDIDKCAA